MIDFAKLKKGALRDWLKKKFGKSAFDKKGRIKMSILKKAKELVKKEKLKKDVKTKLLRRINLAIIMKRFKK